MGDVEKIEGKHVEIRSHRGWTDETGFTPLIRRLGVKMRHDSLEPPHRRDDRELLYVNFVLVSEPARVAAALAKNAMFRASEIRADRTRLEWYAEGQTPASFGR